MAELPKNHQIQSAIIKRTKVFYGKLWPVKLKVPKSTNQRKKICHPDYFIIFPIILQETVD